MEKTKESKKNKKGKHKEKTTIGDIIFRILIVAMIFCIAVIFYSFYIKSMH